MECDGMREEKIQYVRIGWDDKIGKKWDRIG